MISKVGFPEGCPPAMAIMTACEVLTWIAFRRAIPNRSLNVLFMVSNERWTKAPTDVVLRALGILAGTPGVTAPYDPFLSIALAEQPFLSNRPDFPALGRFLLDRLRDQHCKESGRNLSYADMAQILSEEMDRDKQTSQKLHEARAQLKDRLAGNLLTAFGLPVGADGEPQDGTDIGPIARTVFMHPRMTVTERDTAEPETIGSAAASG